MSSAPRACPICASGGPDDVLLDLGVAWVTAPADAPLPQYVCVVAREHVEEPFELTADASHAFWDLAMSTARALKAACAARKLNYEIHGNTVPHLHLHLYPRHAGDPWVGRPIDGGDRRFHREPADLAALAAAIGSAR